VAGDAVAHGLAGLGGGDGPVHVLHRAVVPGPVGPGAVVRQGNGRGPTAPSGARARRSADGPG
jgi:hypothetical protein